MLLGEENLPNSDLLKHLPINYRPPSALGIAIPQTQNIYNADPKEPLYKSKFQVGLILCLPIGSTSNSSMKYINNLSVTCFRYLRTQLNSNLIDPAINQLYQLQVTPTAAAVVLRLGE